MSESKSNVFFLDGREVEALPGETIWQVARRLGTEIPHLCYAPEPGYRADGNCRACMVEIEGERVLAASCIRTPTPGMKVVTANARTKAARNMVENLGNDARGQGVWVYTLGLGSQLNGYEGITSCGYNTADYGSNILKRVANAQGVDTWNSTQPTGLYVYAADAGQLDSAFATIASEIIRLSR